MTDPAVKNNFHSSFQNIDYSLFYSVKDFSSEEWNKIAGSKIFLQHPYLTALENAKPAGMSFKYGLIYEKRILKAICSFQIADLTSKELGSLINLDSYSYILSSVANKINRILFSGSKYSSNNLIVCGSLFVSGEYGIAGEENFFPVVFKILPEIIENISEKINRAGGRVIAVSVKDFYSAHDHSAKELLKNRFHRMVLDPNMIFIVNKEWNSFDDYLEALSAKYRLRANNVIKKLEGAEKKYLELNDIEKEKEEIEKLYQQVQRKAPVRIVRADIHYFLELKKILKDEFVFRAFYLEGKIIAFTSGIKWGGHYEAHFIGIDYHYNKSHALYQNILYDFIHEAIKNKSEELIFGRTAMEIKSTVGAVAYPLYSYIKFTNTVLNKLVKPFVPSSENKNWIPRNPFRKEE